MNDIMIDLETMGHGPDAAIVAIGAVAIGRDTRTLGERFYAVVDLASSVEAGGQMDPKTVLWWMRQGADAREAIAEPGEPIADVLARFSAWVAGMSVAETARIWGCGADFDNVILASAYRRCGMTPPWSYWNNRCYRTMRAEHTDISQTRTGTKHNALDDAETQARHLLEILESHQRIYGPVMPQIDPTKEKAAAKIDQKMG